MTFEIPFDKRISITQYTLRLKMTFKKNLGKSAVNVFWKTSRRLKKLYYDMVILREEHNDTTTW
jgi:hypothetical protein